MAAFPELTAAFADLKKAQRGDALGKVSLLNDYQRWRPAEKAVLDELEKAVSKFERRIEVERRARLYPASEDSRQARIAALKEELAALEGRHDGDASGVFRTLVHGIPEGSK